MTVRWRFRIDSSWLPTSKHLRLKFSVEWESKFEQVLLGRQKCDRSEGLTKWVLHDPTKRVLIKNTQASSKMGWIGAN